MCVLVMNVILNIIVIWALKKVNKDSAKAWVEPVVSIMYWLRFGAFVLKYLAGTLLIYGFWRYTQIVRRAENTSLTTPTAPPEPPASPKA